MEMRGKYENPSILVSDNSALGDKRTIWFHRSIAGSIYFSVISIHHQNVSQQSKVVLLRVDTNRVVSGVRGFRSAWRHGARGKRARARVCKEEGCLP
jgi:hypothetical protein